LPDADSESFEEAVRGWVAPYRNADHLYRTLDWIVALEPNASQAVRLAALTHDIERHFPGGPRADPRRGGWADPDYLRAHSERSARFVAQWLGDRGAEESLVRSTVELVRAHELGGSPEADLLQGADSLSFLEVNGWLVAEWIASGRSTIDEAREKLDWMFSRIRDPRARELAEPLHRRALRRLEV
jgi:hypothetical protein